MVFRLALAWGCTPREVLDRISSEDLAEWVAFETAHGPIDSTYERILLNEIHYQLQTLNYMFGAANFTDEEEGIENPIPEPSKMPFPWEMTEAAKVAKENARD
jgi:hypothetical protein